MKHFQIGDKVKSTGLMSPESYGEIIGVQIGYSYFMSNPHLYGFLKQWAEIDPDWLIHPVYTVKKYLRDLPFFTDDERIPVEAREAVKQAWEKDPNVARQRFIVYLPAELEKLPDDYDWTQKIEDAVNKEQSDNDI